MKKYLFLLACALFTQSFYAQPNADTAINEDEKVEVPHRKAYAYFQSNRDFGDSSYGIGTFYLDSPESTELLHSFNDIFQGTRIGIYAGAVANNIFYGCSYEYKPYGPPAPGNLISIELETGNKKDIGVWTDDQYMKVLDMTYDYKNDIMYASAYNPEVRGIYSVDLSTGKLNKIVDTEFALGAIAANYDGELYGLSASGILYKIEKETGKMTEICKTEYGTPGHMWSLEFDHTDGNLYWVGSSLKKDNAAHYYLFRFNMGENPVTYENIGQIASETSEAKCYGLYIPFVLGGEYVPASPSDFTIIPDEKGELKAKLKWTNPSKNFGGSDLTALSSVTVIRNNDTIATIQTSQIGEAMEWTDETVPTHGEYEYAIYASNNSGNGEKVSYTKYIGPDSPAAVNNIIAEISGNCESVSLTWEKSENGAHGNYFNPDNVTYKIVRYPDETVIAENLKETSCTDNNIKRLARYYYEVYAINEFGENAALSKNYIVAGPAMDIPYADSFADNNITLNQISMYDSNNDQYSWLISSGWGYSQFGDNTTSIEYFINPTLTPSSTQSTDEWFITPPFNLEAGKQYMLTFEHRSIKDEILEITTGKNNSPEIQNVHKTLDLSALSEGEKDFTENTILLPAPAEDCIQCIGFHLTTPFPEDRYSFLQITNIEIKEYVSVDEAEIEELVTVKAIDGNVIIEGQFNEAEVYSADGMKVASTCENIIPAGTLEKGLYLVRVMKDNKAETFKVML